jgi:hypothetical protein
MSDQSNSKVTKKLARLPPGELGYREAVSAFVGLVVPVPTKPMAGYKPSERALVTCFLRIGLCSGLFGLLI